MDNASQLPMESTRLYKPSALTDLKRAIEMRNLEYRSARLRANFDVDFITGVEMFRGTCVDVSETGVRAKFALHVPEGMFGSLIIHHPQRKMILTVRVVYLLKDEAGFAFFEPTSGDQEVLSHLMSLLVNNGAPTHRA